MEFEIIDIKTLEVKKTKTHKDGSFKMFIQNILLILIPKNPLKNT